MRERGREGGRELEREKGRKGRRGVGGRGGGIRRGMGIEGGGKIGVRGRNKQREECMDEGRG